MEGGCGGSEAWGADGSEGPADWLVESVVDEARMMSGVGFGIRDGLAVTRTAGVGAEV